jgi:hypothetical protein
MADPTYIAAELGEFFCPAGGRWYVASTNHKASQTSKTQWSRPIATQETYLTLSGTCARQAPNSSVAALQTHARMDALAIVFVQQASRQLFTISLPEDRAVVKPRSGLARRHRPFGDVAMQVGLDRRKMTTIYLHKIDPCMNNSTCPEEKLEPSYWDRPDQYEYFKALNILLASNTPSPNNGSKPSGAVIVGAAVGSLAFVAILIVAVCLLCRRYKHTQKQTGSDFASAMEENNPAGGLASSMSAGTGAYCSFL